MGPRIKLLLEFPKEFWLMLITYLPGNIGIALRNRHWGKKLKYLGEKVRIDTGVYFQNPEFIEINDNCWIDRGVIILAGKDKSNREKKFLINKDYKGEDGVVHIGRNVHIASGVTISGISTGVYISDNCGISANCKLYSFSHHYRSIKDPKKTDINFSPMVSHENQCLIEGPIFIGKNSGIALNSVILPGASIPENCFVTINSVVSKCKFSPNSIISGNPAKKTDIRYKLDE